MRCRTGLVAVFLGVVAVCGFLSCLPVDDLYFSKFHPGYTVWDIEGCADYDVVSWVEGGAEG
jgi:hypothetical protein